MFENSLNESGETSHQTLTMPLALAVHAALIAVLLLIPISRPARVSSAPLFDVVLPPASGLWDEMPSGPEPAAVEEAPLIDPEAMVAPAEIPRDVQFFEDGVTLPTIAQTGSGVGGGLGPDVENGGLFGNSLGGGRGAGGPGPPRPAAPQPRLPGIAESGPLRLSAGVAEGFLISSPRLSYPDLALQARVEGIVVLEAVISEQGRIRPETVRIVAGHPILARAASAAVLDWQYEPYRLNGQPVEVVTTITVSYRLR